MLIPIMNCPSWRRVFTFLFILLTSTGIYNNAVRGDEYAGGTIAANSTPGLIFRGLRRKQCIASILQQQQQPTSAPGGCRCPESWLKTTELLPLLARIDLGNKSHCNRELDGSLNSMVNDTDVSSTSNLEGNFTLLSEQIFSALKYIRSLRVLVNQSTFATGTTAPPNTFILADTPNLSNGTVAWLTQFRSESDTAAPGNSMSLEPLTLQYFREVVHILMLANNWTLFLKCAYRNNSDAMIPLDFEPYGTLCSVLGLEGGNSTFSDVAAKLNDVVGELSFWLLRQRITALSQLLAEFHDIVIFLPDLNASSAILNQSSMRADVINMLCTARTIQRNEQRYQSPIELLNARSAQTQINRCTNSCMCSCKRLCSLVKTICTIQPSVCSQATVEQPLIAQAREAIDIACNGTCLAGHGKEQESGAMINMQANAEPPGGLSASSCMKHTSILDTLSCPRPLRHTSAPAHRWKPFHDFVTDVSKQTCQLLQSFNLSTSDCTKQHPFLSCGLPCEPIYYKQQYWLPVRIFLCLLGTLACILSWAATLVFFMNRERVKTLARRVVVCLNIGFGVYLIDFLVLPFDGARGGLNGACTDEQVLRTSIDPGGKCGFDAFRVMFSLIAITYLGPPAAHAWYRTVNTLTNRMHSRSMSRDRFLFKLYIAVALGAALISTTTGLAMHSVEPSALLGACRFNARLWLFTFTIPFMMGTVIALPILAAGIPKLRSLLKASERMPTIQQPRPATLSVTSLSSQNGYQASRPPGPIRTPSVSASLTGATTATQGTAAAQTSTRPAKLQRMSRAISRRLSRSPSQGSQRRMATAGLTRLSNLLLWYLIIMCFQSTIVFVAHMVNFFNMESGKNDNQLLEHVKCVMTLPPSDPLHESRECPAIPTDSIIYQILLHTFTSIVAIIFTTWAFEWPYWTWLPCFKSRAVTSVDSRTSNRSSHRRSGVIRSAFAHRWSMFSRVSATSISSVHNGVDKGALPHRPPVNDTEKKSQFVDTPV